MYTLNFEHTHTNARTLFFFFITISGFIASLMGLVKLYTFARTHIHIIIMIISSPYKCKAYTYILLDKIRLLAA